MIPSAYITEWRENASWVEDYQVEQDLLISRVLCELYSEPLIKKSLAFRGGTSLQKIFLKSPQRYSEDIDLVQIIKAPIGEIISLIRKKLNWLNQPTVDQKPGRVTLKYKYISENEPKQSMKLKIETNSSEHFAVLGYDYVPFEMQSSWFTGKVDITTFKIEEIMGTKLRALYQRKKGRDLFDFQKVFNDYSNISGEKIVDCFSRYMTHHGNSISRAQFEKNLDEKMNNSSFKQDISPLLAPGGSFNMDQAFHNLMTKVIIYLPGEPWKRPKK